MRILVAEDDKKIRSHVVGALRAAGHVVDDTGDGEESLWLLLEHPYDAAVLDITMPGRDGVSVTRALRAAGKALPVLLGGLYLTDNPTGWPTQHRVAPLCFIPAGGYSVFQADGNSSAGPDPSTAIKIFSM